MVVAGKDLRVLGPTGELERVELVAPVRSTGALIVGGEAIYALDDDGNLLRWDGDPLRETYRRPVVPPTTAKRKKKTSERCWLALEGGRLWLGYARGPRSTGKLLELDPATGEPLAEYELAEARAFAARADRWAVAQNTSVSGRVSVWTEGQRQWPDAALSASGALVVTVSGEAAFTEGPPAVRWSRHGSAQQLPGDRVGRISLRPLPEGGGYVCVSPSLDLELWENDAVAPAHVWRRRTRGSPLGATELQAVVALQGRRAVGYSRQTLGERKETPTRSVASATC